MPVEYSPLVAHWNFSPHAVALMAFPWMAGISFPKSCLFNLTRAHTIQKWPIGEIDCYAKYAIWSRMYVENLIFCRRTSSFSYQFLMHSWSRKKETVSILHQPTSREGFVILQSLEVPRVCQVTTIKKSNPQSTVSPCLQSFLRELISVTVGSV